MGKEELPSSQQRSLPTRSDRRRILRFSLRGLLAATLLVAVFCCWLHRQIEHGRQQERSVAELDQLGVYVYTYEPNTLGRSIRKMSPLADQWGQRILGHGALYGPSAVSINRSLEGEGFARLIEFLQGFPELRKADLLRISVLSQADLKRLRKELPNVQIESMDDFNMELNR